MLTKYDLRNTEFYRNDETLEEVILEPGGSTFVGAVESIALPNDMVAYVGLKNSRIRQGLTLDAPIYFPGHKTRIYYRVTNVSANEITLAVEHDIAQVFFERLQVPVEAGYSGAFADEFSFAGVGNYKDVYGSETRKAQRETEKLENVEQRVYGNVVAIMGVFIALFTMVSVDLVLALKLAAGYRISRYAEPFDCGRDVCHGRSHLVGSWATRLARSEEDPLGGLAVGIRCRPPRDAPGEMALAVVTLLARW